MAGCGNLGYVGVRDVSAEMQRRPRCRRGDGDLDEEYLFLSSATVFPSLTTCCHIGGVNCLIADNLMAVASSSCME